MSSNLCFFKIVKRPEISTKSELKYLFRELFNEDNVDYELSEQDIPILRAAKAGNTDVDIDKDLEKIIKELEKGNIILAKEVW